LPRLTWELAVCTTQDRLAGGDIDPALRDCNGFFLDLFRGPEEGDESAEERAARLAAARDILNELLWEGVEDAVARQHVRYALRVGGFAVLVVPGRVNVAPGWRQVGRAV
jgi:hypothetical protein